MYIQLNDVCTLSANRTPTTYNHHNLVQFISILNTQINILLIDVFEDLA